MKKIKLISDSTLISPEGFVEENNISIIPLTVEINGKSYKDGVDIGKEEFVDAMSKSEELPKTSQPSIGKFVEIYDRFKDDYDEIVSIHLSNGLSGTFETAKQAAEISEANVTVINSHSTDQGLWFQINEIVNLINDGVDNIDEFKKAVEKIQKETKIYIGITNLDNLISGGRISKMQGLVANIFNIKLGIEFGDDKISVIEKGRGKKVLSKFYKNIIKEMQEREKINKIGISHVGIKNVALELRDKIKETFPEIEINVLDTTPVIATHTGMGGMAVEFY